MQNHTPSREALTSYSREPMLLLLSPAAASGAPAICLVHVSHACGITAHQPAGARRCRTSVLPSLVFSVHILMFAAMRSLKRSLD